MASLVTDKNILEFYVTCFNRSAFNDPIRCDYFQVAPGRELEYWFDSTRAEIIDTLESVCSEAGIIIYKYRKRNNYRNW